ncbi:hypothetical protein OSB04_031208, partial [Centaurea solstitialis]
MESNAKWVCVVSSCSTINNGSSTSGINMHNLIVCKENNGGWRWQPEDNEFFPVRSLRMLIDCITSPSAGNKTIWVKWVTSRANIHLWLTLNNRLTTMDNLSSSNRCTQCNVNSESSDHILGFVRLQKLLQRIFLRGNGVEHPAGKEIFMGWQGEHRPYPPRGQERATRRLSYPCDVWSKLILARNGADRIVRRTIATTFFWVLGIQRNCKVFKGTIRKDKKISKDIRFIPYDWIR